MLPNEGYFIKIHIQYLKLPSRFLPNIEFIKYHNQESFRQWLYIIYIFGSYGYFSEEST